MNEAFIKTPRQLLIVIVAAFAVPIQTFFLLPKLVTSEFHLDMESPAMTPEALVKHRQPIGQSRDRNRRRR